jgi:hypothetical protein
MLSCQHERNVPDGKKRILLNPTPELRREHETVTFEEGEVYGVDVLVVSGADGKVSAQCGVGRGTWVRWCAGSGEGAREGGKRNDRCFFAEPMWLFSSELELARGDVSWSEVPC